MEVNALIILAVRYTKSHEWVESLDGGRYRVGITDYAQGQLG